MLGNKKIKVSICTPTYNRRPFIPYLIECVKHQTFPLDQLEWIIVDDGTDPISDLVQHLPWVKYYFIPEKMPLGKKRNLMHTYCSGEFLVYMDDDDFYPEERVSHAVEMLEAFPEFLIAGTSEMHMYFKSVSALYQCGPYGDSVATAATFAFRRELLNKTQYADTDGFTEEPHFLKTGGIVLQLNPLKTILVVSHPHNSLNKEILLENPGQFLLSPSRFQVADFIKSPILTDFYIYTADLLLSQYDCGTRQNKPQLDLVRLSNIELEIKSKTSINLAQQLTSIVQSMPYKQMKEALEAKIDKLQNQILLQKDKSNV